MWKSYEARRLECTARSAPITPVTRRPRESACGVGRAAPADVCAVAGWSRRARARGLSSFKSTSIIAFVSNYLSYSMLICAQ